MKRDLAQLTDSEFDLAIIGGGIFGACAAWDAAQRGLSVVLVERGDFCGSTSANHLKMVHGGIRYIQHGDISRVRKSSNERSAFFRIAPHLVRPLPIVIPTYGWGMKGKTVLRVGTALYDLLTLDRNRGIADPARHIPWGHSLGRDEVLQMFPGLPDNGLTGGAVFCDGQVHNPPRLVLEILQSAVQAGASIANYVEVTGLVRRGERVDVVQARDVLTGEELEIRARIVLNAAGPYAESLLERTLHKRLTPKGIYSRDAYFIVPRKFQDHGHALAVQGMSSDPDARFSRGARHLFLAPWREHTLVGVWHVVWDKHPDSVVVTDEELEKFISEVNAACPSLGIGLEDVSLWNAGLVPFGENDAGAKDLRYGHRSRLIDHAATDGIPNLITLIGVRFTTGRLEAERAVDLVFRKLQRSCPPCRTSTTPAVGGDIEVFATYADEAMRHSESKVPDEVVKNLVSNYGTRFQQVLRHLQEDPSLGGRAGDSLTILAQVVHAVGNEMAQTLGDVVFRRTDLATGSYPGKRALQQCSDVLVRKFGWDENRLAREIIEVQERFPSWAIRRVDEADEAAGE